MNASIADQRKRFPPHFFGTFSTEQKTNLARTGNVFFSSKKKVKKKKKKKKKML